MHLPAQKVKQEGVLLVIPNDYVKVGSRDCTMFKSEVRDCDTRVTGNVHIKDE